MNAFDKALEKINKVYGEELIKQGTEITHCDKIPFSSPRLNYMTYGGVPIGKATEFFGEESGGKTTTAIDAVKNAQKLANKLFNEQKEKMEAEIAELEAKEAKWAKDDLKKLKPKYDKLIEDGPRKVVYVDAENTFDEEWAKLNGVDVTQLYMIRPQNQTAEQVLDIINDLLETGMVLLLVLDSLPMLIPKSLFDEDMDKKIYGGIAGVVTNWTNKVSNILSKHKSALIIINQSREDMDNPFNKFKTPGGRALKHLYALRLFFKRGSFIDEDNNELPNRTENPYGNLVDVTIVKTKVCKPDRRVGFYTLNYFQGIDVLSDTLDLAIKYGYIVKSGSWYRIIDAETGELVTMDDGETELNFQGKAKLNNFFREHPEMFDELWEVVNEKAIAK